MGSKSSVVPQLDFLLPSLVLKCHRPTKLTGKHNIDALKSLRVAGLAGMTSKELAAKHDWMIGTAGPCLYELRCLGFARKTGARRSGYIVYIASN